jgi:hypothetical protein
MKKKKVLLILTGGTFGMKETKVSQVLRPGDLDGDRILEAVPEVKVLAKIDWVSVFNLDSSDISPAHWENNAKTIKEKYLDLRRLCCDPWHRYHVLFSNGLELYNGGEPKTNNIYRFSASTF